MKLVEELNLEMFEAWGGAETTLEKIIDAGKVNEFECLLEEEYPDGISSTGLNDYLRFEEDFIFSALGISDEEDEEEGEFEVEITITYDDEELPLERTLKGEDLTELKVSVIPTVKEMCKEHGVTGLVYVEIDISRNGEYFDHDDEGLEV